MSETVVLKVVVVLKFLVGEEQGVDIHATNEYGWMTLMWAAGEGHLEVVKYLKVVPMLGEGEVAPIAGLSVEAKFGVGVPALPEVLLASPSLTRFLIGPSYKAHVATT